jgi:large subunit ribosomal protein L10
LCGGSMPKAEKVERVAELKGRIDASDALLLTEYRGLSVADITALRRSLAEGGTRFSVVKNTLMQRAAAQSGLDGLLALLEGPSAVAFVAGDPVAAAKKVVEAAKRFPTLVLKGGYLEGRVLTADEARSLADLESREAMLSKVAGLMKTEMSRAASMFVSAQATFLSLLEALKEKIPGEDEAAEPIAEATAEPAEATAEPAEATAEPAEATAEPAEATAEPASSSEETSADDGSEDTVEEEKE